VTSYLINHGCAPSTRTHAPTRARQCSSVPPIKVNKRLTIHPTNGKVRKQKRPRPRQLAPPYPPRAELPLIIKQTFSRLRARDLADPLSARAPSRRLVKDSFSRAQEEPRDRETVFDRKLRIVISKFPVLSSHSGKPARAVARLSRTWLLHVVVTDGRTDGRAKRASTFA